MSRILSLTLLTSLALAATASAAPHDATYRGTLQTGIVAIGGETTGIVLGEYELDLHGDASLLATADHLDGKHAVVVGTLTAQHGVEIPERHIIRVTKLVPDAS